MAKGCRQTRVHLINLITELWISRIYWWLRAALFPPPGVLLRAGTPADTYHRPRCRFGRKRNWWGADSVINFRFSVYINDRRLHVLAFRRAVVIDCYNRTRTAFLILALERLFVKNWNRNAIVGRVKGNTGRNSYSTIWLTFCTKKLSFRKRCIRFNGVVHWYCCSSVGCGYRGWINARQPGAIQMPLQVVAKWRATWWQDEVNVGGCFAVFVVAPTAAPAENDWEVNGK